MDPGPIFHGVYSIWHWPCLGYWAATVSSSTTHLAYTSAVGDTSEGDRTDSVTGSPWWWHTAGPWDTCSSCCCRVSSSAGRTSENDRQHTRWWVLLSVTDTLAYHQPCHQVHRLLAFVGHVLNTDFHSFTPIAVR